MHTPRPILASDSTAAENPRPPPRLPPRHRPGRRRRRRTAAAGADLSRACMCSRRCTAVAPPLWKVMRYCRWCGGTRRRRMRRIRAAAAKGGRGSAGDREGGSQGSALLRARRDYVLPRDNSLRSLAAAPREERYRCRRPSGCWLPAPVTRYFRPRHAGER